MSKKITSLGVAAAVAGAVSLAVLIPASNAAEDKVRCYGIAQAGQNDCESATGKHSCNGNATLNYDGGDWKYVSSKDECEARNGKLEPFEGKNPAYKS